MPLNKPARDTMRGEGTRLPPPLPASPSPAPSQRGVPVALPPVHRKHLAVMDNGDHWRPLADRSHRHHHGIFKISITFSLPNSPA